MAKPILTQSRLKEVLHYCQETGVFTWLVSTARRICIGDVAGSVDGHGYRVIRIDNKIYQAHRLAWLYVHGNFPPDDIDHINRVRTDNRICNLRMATRSENMQNGSIPSHNTSGHMGVTWVKQRQKWRAYIMVNQNPIHLGYFTDLTEAIAARKSAEIKFHTFQNAAFQPAAKL